MVLVIILSVLLLASLIALQVRVYMKLKTQTRLIEIQRYQQEKQQKLLEELIQEKQQIIGLISHDLKGPFNRIFALIQLLSMTSTNLTEEQLDYIGKIHQISSDGLSMLRNLVDNRRLDDKGIDLFPEKLSLTNLVNTMVKNYKALAEKKKIQLFFEKENDFIIFSDKISLNRIIENILSNALKFSPAGKNIYVKLFQRDEKIELDIIDEGPGISPDDQAKLFQKYQRLSARPTAGESSTGLGLYLVKTMVEKIGGSVSYESGQVNGSIFKIMIPQKLPA